MSSPILQGDQYGLASGARSFPRWHIAYRAVWKLTWMLLARWTPPPLYGWRRFLLRLFGARIAKGARVYGSARIWYPPNLEMAQGAVLGPHVDCYTMDRIVLGKACVVSQYARLVTGTHDTECARFQLGTRPILLDDHVWIAADAFVGPGVTVGEGAVLGARGVAFKDLAPWTIYAGNPARRIRERTNFTL